VPQAAGTRRRLCGSELGVIHLPGLNGSIAKHPTLLYIPEINFYIDSIFYAGAVYQRSVRYFSLQKNNVLYIIVA